jgi:hypothetical protein
VRTALNNREPFFRLWWAAALFFRVFREAKALFVFEIRGFTLEGEWLSFYIKPADGFQLPRIMQWMKQTFAVRFNACTGRTGHLWGNRYKSWILAGEPPEWAGEVDWAAVDAAAAIPIPAARTGVRSNGACPQGAEKAAKTGFSPKIPRHSASPPG